MAKISKRKQAANEIDRTRSYPLAEAVSMIKASAAASKFDETIAVSYTHLTLPTMLWV